VPRYVAFLRGINLGGKRRVPMAELRAVLADAGYENVLTHLQSGNVALTSGANAGELERALSEQLERAFGFRIGVVVRSRDELANVIAADPFGEEAQDPARYQVSFLSEKPDRQGVKELEAAQAAPEQVFVRGREVYGWHPGGVGRSELAKQITAKGLGVKEATARNWRTITKLLELADSPPEG
jgi:uncharacterized protein (DUF1697 family)